MRSEGARLTEAVEELLRIAREAEIPAEIYHLKAAGKSNWQKMDQVIAMVEGARREGLKITADMYTYPAGSTGLDAAMPPWVLDGGFEAAYKGFGNPKRVKRSPKRSDRLRTNGRACSSPLDRPIARCSSASKMRASKNTPARRWPKWRSCEMRITPTRS